MKLGQCEMVVDGQKLLIHEPPRKTRFIAYAGTAILVVYVLTLVIRNYPNTSEMIRANVILYIAFVFWGIWEIRRPLIKIVFDGETNQFSAKNKRICSINEVGFIVTSDPISKSIQIFDRTTEFLNIQTNRKTQVDDFVNALEQIAPKNPYICTYRRIHHPAPETYIETNS